MAVNTTIDTVGDLIKALKRFPAETKIAFAQATNTWCVGQIALATVTNQERVVVSLDTEIPG